MIQSIQEQAQETTSTTTTTPSTTSKETTTIKKETVRTYNWNYFSPASSSFNSYYNGHQYKNKKKLSPEGPFMWHDEFNSLNLQRWKQTVSASAHFDNSFQYFSSHKGNRYADLKLFLFN